MEMGEHWEKIIKKNIRAYSEKLKFMKKIIKM
jgi:hypothetical protein